MGGGSVPTWLAARRPAERSADNIKNKLRMLAHMATEYSALAYAARPKRVHVTTMLKLANMVARRDGTGFYGPQP
jgi:hypothetical protein